MTKSVFILFISVLIFSPLAFGTVEPWSLTIMESLSFLALFLFLAGNIRRKEALYETPGIIPLLCLLIFMWLQLLPLPPDVVRIISPGTYDIYRDTIFIDEPMGWISLSINRKATLMEFFRIASYTVFYVLTVQLFTKKEIFKKTVTILIIFASLLALFATLQHFLPNDKIYWVRKLTQEGNPFGPYVNRNHYAGLMEMMLPLVLGLFLFYKPHATYKSFRDKITEIFNKQRTNIHILLGFSAVLIATSIFLTLSRSGIVSLCISMIFFAVLFLARGANKGKGAVIIVIFVLIILSVSWFGWAPIIERFERIKNTQGEIAEMRAAIWKDSVNIIRDFPLTGTGFGSFVNIYPKYRTISGDAIAEHAHNDYIELVSDGGGVALFLCIWFLLAIFYKSFRLFLKRREMYSIYLFIAAIAGIMSILFHSLTDFNLHIGANGLYFFFLAGLAVSAANTRMRDGLSDTYLKEMRLPLKGLIIPVALVFSGSLIFNTGVTAGKFYFSHIKDTKLNEKTLYQDIASIKETAYKASFYDPLEARYRFAAADAERLLLNNDTALSLYKESVRLNPVSGEYLQRLGLIMSETGRYDLAGQLLRAGIHFDVSNPVRYKRYALWLFSMGEKDEGIRITRQAISLEPGKTREYITLMVLNGLSDDDIIDSLPERVEPHLQFASYLSRTGKDEMAEEEYFHALRYVAREDPLRPSYFYEAYRYFLKRNRFGDALNIMRRAMEVLPNNAGIRLHAGELYEKLAMPDKAAEEYRQALVLDPNDQEAKKRIDKLLSKNK